MRITLQSTARSYRNRDIGAHFAKLVGLVVGVGLLAGILLAGLIGSWMTHLYGAYYRFPDLLYEMALGEAMRPEAPPTYRATLLEDGAPVDPRDRGVSSRAAA